MSNKELILKRLLEGKHISVEELFILNKNEFITKENTIGIKNLNPYPRWQRPHIFYPFLHTINTNTNNINSTELIKELPSDYKMD